MRQPGIVIIDYDVGNTRSVWSAIDSLGYRKLRISDKEQDILAANALILPGVGAFAACAANLRVRGLDAILNEAVLQRQKPILGICVGMQLMATASEENGVHDGLNWIPGRVSRLKPVGGLAVPHVGWNDIHLQGNSGMYERLPEDPNFYFDHSYHYCCEPRFVAALCDYGQPVVAAVHRASIHGVQFHPEKSQTNGLKLFRGFFNMVSQC